MRTGGLEERRLPLRWGWCPGLRRRAMEAVECGSSIVLPAVRRMSIVPDATGVGVKPLLELLTQSVDLFNR